MSNFKDYLEAKKGSIKDKAKKAAITGLVAATILTGAAGLTGCDKEPVQAGTEGAVEAIESKVRGIKDNFEFDSFNVVNNGGECRIVLHDRDEATVNDESSLGLKFIITYDVTEDFYNEVYEKVQGDENVLVSSLYGVKGIMFEPEAMKDEKYADILAEIKNIVANNEPSYYEDYEAPVMGD